MKPVGFIITLALAAGLIFVGKGRADESAGKVRIVAFTYDQAARQVHVTFSSVPGVEYGIDGSSGLHDWSEELAGSVIGASGTTTTVSGLTIPLPDRDQFFLRVRRLPPFMETVPVGNPGNDPDTSPFDRSVGSVGYTYHIGKFEVTNEQYAAFLNAVAGDDTHSLYDMQMDTSPEGGITRSGASPNFTYKVKENMAKMPVIGVSWFDAARFCNWLHNGRTTGNQTPDKTEDGAYNLTDSTRMTTGTHPIHGANGRKAGARWHLPGADEWHKAAYHEPGASSNDYWSYPTRSDEAPVVGPPTGGSNSANYDTGAATVTEVGAYRDSPSFYGTFDQGGNILEWTEQISRSFSPDRELRGGTWFQDNGGLQSWFQDIGSPDRGGSSTGFRVACPAPAGSTP